MIYKSIYVCKLNTLIIAVCYEITICLLLQFFANESHALAKN